MDPKHSHKFRLDDFDTRPRVTTWETLPPIAAHVRWLKLRLVDLLPPKVTVEEQMAYQRGWRDLVDSEAATWRYGNSPHGWYARQPDRYDLPVDADSCVVADSHVDDECSDEWDVIGVPSSTGTEVVTASTWLREVEDCIRSNSGGVQAYEWSDRRFDTGELAGFLSVIAAHCVQDAESLLIGGKDEASAWHCITEATELINRAERLRMFEVTPIFWTGAK